MSELLAYIKVPSKFAPDTISCVDKDCDGTMHTKTYKECWSVGFTDGVWDKHPYPSNKQYYECSTCKGVHLARKLPNATYTYYG